jgi:hypothetical protein
MAANANIKIRKTENNHSFPMNLLIKPYIITETIKMQIKNIIYLLCAFCEIFCFICKNVDFINILCINK